MNLLDTAEYVPQKTLTKETIARLALESGFSEYQDWCLSGVSENDRLVAVEEYPIGESILKFAKAIIESVNQE